MTSRGLNRTSGDPWDGPVQFAKTKPKFLTPDGTSPAKMGGNKFTRFAAKLKAKPGQWAKYPGD